MIGVRCLEWLSVDPAASVCPENDLFLKTPAPVWSTLLS
jgi:hypothetical protein